MSLGVIIVGNELSELFISDIYTLSFFGRFAYSGSQVFLRKDSLKVIQYAWKIYMYARISNVFLLFCNYSNKTNKSPLKVSQRDVRKELLLKS